MPVLSVACSREEKSRWRQLSAKLGYPGTRFSQFVRLFLNAAAGKYDEETWEARTLYLSEGKIGLQRDGPDSVAFRVVGPGHFWRYVDREADRVARVPRLPREGAMIETVLLLAAAGLAAAAVAGRFLSGLSSGGEAEGEAPPSPAEIVRSVALELVSQARPEKREELAQVLLEHLSRGGSDWAQLAIPCDRKGAPLFELVERVATGVAEAAGVQVRVERVVLESWPMALVTAGDGADPSDAEWVLARVPRRARFGARYGAGGLLALVIQTVISASIGTVTSMGVQSLVRSAGGERRLARLLRRHRDAEAGGDTDRAARIREKILSSASRIKGREVDWSEVASLEARG